MSYCRQEGKDKIVFVTEEDHAEASRVALPDFEDEPEYEGLIKANGEINWECPCLGGMATGVCGEQFKSAFSCFHHSQSEPKGSECIDQFRTMQECFRKYPDIYGEFESVDEEEKNDLELFNGEDSDKKDGEKDDVKDEKEKNETSSEMQLTSKNELFEKAGSEKNASL